MGLLRAAWPETGSGAKHGPREVRAARPPRGARRGPGPAGGTRALRGPVAARRSDGPRVRGRRGHVRVLGGYCRQHRRQPDRQQPVRQRQLTRAAAHARPCGIPSPLMRRRGAASRAAGRWAARRRVFTPPDLWRSDSCWISVGVLPVTGLGLVGEDLDSGLI